MATRSSRFTVPAAVSRPATSFTSTPRFRCGTTRRVPARSSTHWRGPAATRNREVNAAEEIREVKDRNSEREYAASGQGPPLLYLISFIYFIYFLSLIFKMRRVFIGGIALLLCGGISARSKRDPLMFVFLRVDREQDVAILRPMIAPNIGVLLDSGPRELKPGTVLQCWSSVREHDAIVETRIAKVTDLVLDCGEQKFVVKTVEFSPRAK